MSGIIQGAKSIGMFSDVAPPATLPAYGEDSQAVIDYLLSKVADLQTLVEGKADTKRLKTLIQYSDEAIRIQAENIALVGAVTFLDVWRDQTGQVVGGVHPSLTRIRGGVIQTGKIISGNWGTTDGSEIDLDNGTITMGGSSSPKLKFDSDTGNLEITGELKAGSIITNSVTIDGVTIGTIKTQAETGDLLNTALTVSGTTILKGTLKPQDSGALAVGSITWNSTTGALTGGTGIAITEYGIIGAASGSPTFTINAATGAATFAGSLSAATGTFAGSLSAATGTFAGSISAASGTFTGDLVTSGQVTATGGYTFDGQSASMHGVNSGSGYGVRGKSATGTGIYGEGSSRGVSGTSSSSSGVGVYGVVGTGASAIGVLGQAGGIGNANGIALEAWHVGGGTAFNCRGIMTKTGTELVSNLNANYVGGYDAADIMKIGIDALQDLANSDSWTKFQTSNDGVTVASSIYVRKKVW